MSKEFILSALLIINFSSIICHKCGTDLLINKLNLKKNKVFIGGDRRRLSSDFYPIRVKMDYTLLQNQNNRKVISDTNFELFKKELDKMPVYFAKIISVRRETFNANELMGYINYNCQYSLDHTFTINNLNNDDTSSYDLFIYPIIDEELNNNIIAAAAHCVLSPKSYRPIVGIMLLNNNLN